MSASSPVLERLASRAPARPYAETLGAVLDYVGATGGHGRAWTWRARHLRAEIQAWRFLEHAMRTGTPLDVSTALARLDAHRAGGAVRERLEEP